MRPILTSNADVILRGLIEKKLTSQAAARLCKISVSYFRKLIFADQKITYSTAGKLRDFFGDEVISISRAD